MLKFAELTFQLPSLGYADAPADDFSDCFDFSQSPTPFHAFVARLDAHYFLSDLRPPVDPDDD